MQEFFCYRFSGIIQKHSYTEGYQTLIFWPNALV